MPKLVGSAAAKTYPLTEAVYTKRCIQRILQLTKLFKFF